MHWPEVIERGRRKAKPGLNNCQIDPKMFDKFDNRWLILLFAEVVASINHFLHQRVSVSFKVSFGLSELVESLFDQNAFPL